MWERVLRFRYTIQEDAKRKVKVLAFWEKYGDVATKEAFGTGRSTLFRWQKELKEGYGKLESLNNKSRAPKNKRKRVISQAVESLIVKERSYDHQISKDKLVELVRKCKDIAWHEGYGKVNGDMSALIPLLGAALKDVPADEVQKAILGYIPPSK